MASTSSLLMNSSAASGSRMGSPTEQDEPLSEGHFRGRFTRMFVALRGGSPPQGVKVTGLLVTFPYGRKVIPSPLATSRSCPSEGTLRTPSTPFALSATISDEPPPSMFIAVSSPSSFISVANWTRV